MPSASTPTSVERQGWEVWRNTRGTGVTMDEARTLVSDIFALISEAGLNKDC